MSSGFRVAAIQARFVTLITLEKDGKSVDLKMAAPEPGQPDSGL